MITIFFFLLVIVSIVSHERGYEEGKRMAKYNENKDLPKGRTLSKERDKTLSFFILKERGQCE